MFRSRSKFDNEAPMSRRGTRVGLVLTVALAMVAVLASTVGVLSSQSTTPSLTVGSGTYSVAEGEQLTVNLTSSSSEGYDLVLAITPSGDFNFAQDITSLGITPDVGSVTTIASTESFPQTVSIESGTTMITLTFEVADDLYVEPNDSFTLSATPGSGTAATTVITLTDPAAVTVGLSVDGATTINEGQTRNINITLSRPLMEFDALSNSNPPSSYKQSSAIPGSNYEDISTSGTQVYNRNTDGHNREYFVTFADGFEFEFFGGTYGDVSIGTNGYLKLGGPNNGDATIFVTEDNFGDQLYNGGNSGNDLPIVAPFWIDLDLRSVGSSLHREVRGVAPNRRFIVQYTNIEYRPGGAARGRATFQVVLFETTGQIEFRYESISDNQNSAAVGITDGTGTNYAEVGIGKSTTTRVVDDDTRIVFTPDINIVTKDAANQEVATYDIIDEIGFSASMGTIAVSPADNSNWDGNQVHTVELDSPTPLVIADATGPVTYTVMDDDDPEVVLEQVSGSSAEGNSVVLRARLTNAPDGAPEALTVNLARDTASTADAGDYDTIPATVTILAGEQNSNSFTVMITDDTEVEFNENLIIEVTSLVYGANTVMPTTPGVVDITITSDDKITATITASDAAEGGVTTVNISLDQAFPANTPDGAVMLVLDGTDRSNDVSGLPADVTDDLRNGTAASVQVTLTDDSILEGTEVVTVKLLTASVASVLAPVSASFNINDNESGIVSVARVSSTSDYAEGATVEFEFALQPGVTTEVPITVNYELTAATVDEQGNRRAPADASDRAIVLAGGLAPGFAKGLALPVRGLAQMARSVGMETIPKNGNSVRLTIRLTDDTTAEETELLRVGLMGVSAGSGARVEVNNDMDETVIRILDNENPTYEIIGSGEVDEDDGTYPVTLRRLGRLTHNGMPVNQIEFEIVGDGADEGDFRGPLIRKFTFSPGSALSDLIRLPLDDDNSEESDKTFQIRVYAPGQMPGQVTPPPGPTPIVDSSGARFTSITLLDFDVADFFGDLPATGGPVLPVWLLLVLALTGVVLLVPTLRRLI